MNVKNLINKMKKKPVLIIGFFGFCFFAIYLGFKKESNSDEEYKDVIDDYGNSQTTFSEIGQSSDASSSYGGSGESSVSSGSVESLYDFISTSNEQIAESMADAYDKIYSNKEEITSNNNEVTSNYETLTEKVNAIQSTLNDNKTFTSTKVENNTQQVLSLRSNMDQAAKKMTSSLNNERTPLIPITTMSTSLLPSIANTSTSKTSSSKASRSKSSSRKTSSSKTSSSKASSRKTSSRKTSTKKATSTAAKKVIRGLG